MHYTFIVNETAGKGYAAQIEKLICEKLDAQKIPYQVLKTRSAGHGTVLARNAAADPECKAILSVGGDGTAFEVAVGLMNTGMPMGIIPAGSGNDFIKSLGTSKDPMEALDFILTHEPRPVDTARLNGMYFLNVSGLGFDVEVLEQTARLGSKLRGMLPYLVGVIKTIFSYQPLHVSYEVDGRTEEKDVLLLSIANGQYIGGGIHICPAAVVDDGYLDLVVVDKVPRWRVPFYLPGLLRGTILKFSMTHHQRCKRVTVSGKKLKIQLDGEIYQMDHAEISVCEGALNLYW